MNRRSKKYLLLTVALVFIVAAAVGAQEKATQAEPPFSKPYPVGQVTIKLTEVGVGVGMEWGSGVLTYEGKQYTFKVRGIKVAAVGVSSATAQGDVYNLFNVGEFPGHYMAAGTGLAVFRGKEGEAFKNTKGVHILLKSSEKGVKLSIGPEGFTVRLEKAL